MLVYYCSFPRMRWPRKRRSAAWHHFLPNVGWAKHVEHPQQRNSSISLVKALSDDHTNIPTYHTPDIMSINASAWVTLVLFFLSITFVIHPVSFHVPLPVVGRTKITIGLMTAPILAIAILWAAQCLGATHIRDGIVGTGMVPDKYPLCQHLNVCMSRWYQALQYFGSIYLSGIHGHNTRRYWNSSSRRFLGQQ